MTTSARRRLALACAVAALPLAGCSASSDATDPVSATPAADETADATGGMPRDGGAGGGGITGLVASVQDGVMQVQEADSQTAVTWTAETSFSRTVTITVAEVAVGSCAVAMLPTDAAGDATTDTTDTTDVTVTATTVIVSDAVDGACSGGLGGGLPTDLPSGMPTDLPSGMPTELPSGMPTGMADGGMPGGSLVSGRVTAVAGGVLTVEASEADGSSTAVTVATDADTVITTSVAADASAVTVGVCAGVRGESDGRGGMAATSVQLSDAVDGSCSSAGPGAGGPLGFPGGTRGTDGSGGGSDD